MEERDEAGLKVAESGGCLRRVSSCDCFLLWVLVDSSWHALSSFESRGLPTCMSKSGVLLLTGFLVWYTGYPKEDVHSAEYLDTVAVFLGVFVYLIGM